MANIEVKHCIDCFHCLGITAGSDNFRFGFCMENIYRGVIVDDTIKPFKCDLYLNRWVVRIRSSLYNPKLYF